MAAGESEMPFGKYKGEKICDIDIKYLDWLIGQDWFCEKFEDLKNEVEAFLNNEAGYNRGG